ncbi:hypothetical protein Vretimale_9034 [Volvox reticuliferus]|uniref:Protein DETOXIFICATION n=1 Tax=Volvox reticuliferus TaxID=1737510 RepID=A0A8J4CVD2_9CHLO|nr:hypothetical protein Vretifemale_14262 [Volvox reticuliferus]GIM04462.1 hypothetical protein Vretimale_9034 [Volvox reticuliferus]
MTTLAFHQLCCPLGAPGRCGVRLSPIGTLITSRRHQHSRRQHRITCPIKHAPQALAAVANDAFDREQSLGASIRHQLQRVQNVLSSPHDKEIFAVAFPAFLGLSLEPFVNAFNAGMVGHLGTHQLSAVSLGSTVFNSFAFLFSFLLYLTIPEIAAAAAKGDDDEVSRVTSHSLWVALGCGLLTAVALGFGAPHIVAALKPPEPDVVAQAAQYIMIRALTIPAVLLGFVSTAVFRGFKDTRTPLLGTGTSVAVSFCLHVLLLNVLHLDVAGAAIAAALASCSSCCVMMGELVRRGKLRLRHMATPPPLAVVLPILERGAVLSIRNMVSFGMIVFASTICVRMGSAFQASFEVIRQMWMLTMPFFECLGVATQSLCATALGQQDRVAARQVLNRLLVLSTFLGALAGSAVWLLHEPLTAFFTKDPAVVAHVLMALPLICAVCPIDAAGSIMDGALMAAKRSNYMSAVQIVGSAVQYCILVGIASSGKVDAFSVWAAIKVMAATRILGGVFGIILSRKSPYSNRHAESSPVAKEVATTSTATSNSGGEGSEDTPLMAASASSSAAVGSSFNGGTADAVAVPQVDTSQSSDRAAAAATASSTLSVAVAINFGVATAGPTVIAAAGAVEPVASAE